MAVPFSNTKLRVPKGFQNVLEGLAREVLRSQPEDLFEFGTNYFENLLRVRTESGYDLAVHGAKMEDRAYNNWAFKKGRPSKEEGKSGDATTKGEYKTQADRVKAEQEEKVKADYSNNKEAEEAAIRIQAGFRGALAREEIKKRKEQGASPSPTAPPAEEKQEEEEEEIDIDLNDPEVEKAAIKIQAGFKGFKGRKEMQEKRAEQGQQQEGEEEEKPVEQEEKEGSQEEVDIDLEDPEVAKAALTIQSGFRGHMARQEIRQKKEKTLTTQSAPELPSSPRPQQSGDVPASSSAAITSSTQQKQQQQQEDKEEEEGEEEEEVDIDLTDPDVEKAAVKIQAGFKGYQARKKQTTARTGVTERAEDIQEPERTPAGQQGEEEEIDIDLDDPEVEKAAVKIQASFKGFKARKAQSGTAREQPGQEKEEAAAATSASAEQTEASQETSAPAEVQQEPAAAAEPAEQKQEEQQQQEEEEIDIDLNDPEVEKAAIMIQAGFKGFKSRKNMKQGEEGSEKPAEGGEDSSQEKQVEQAPAEQSQESAGQQEPAAEQTPAETAPADEQKAEEGQES